MSHSSLPTGPTTRESLRQALSANSRDLLRQDFVSQLPNMGVPDHSLPISSTGHRSVNSVYHPSPASEPSYSVNQPYGYQFPNANHVPEQYNENPFDESGSYGTYNPAYNANHFSDDTLYGGNLDDKFDQQNGQPVHGQHYGGNNSDSDVDSDDDGTENSTQVFQGAIRNEDHYIQTLSRRLRKATLNDNVEDLPQTEAEQQLLVRELFDSIIDTSDVLDKPGKNGKPAQAVRRFRSGYYSSKDIELKCWEILLRCRDATIGIKLAGLDAKSKREEYEGFRARFQKIVESCRISKALCKQIMDPTYISRLVAAPGTEIQMKFNNKKINAERDIQNAIGRKAVKGGLQINDLDRLIGPGVAQPSMTLDSSQQDSNSQPPTTDNTDQQGIDATLEDGVESSAVFDMSPPEVNLAPKTPKTPKNAAVLKKAAQTTSTAKATSTKRKLASSVKGVKTRDIFDDSDSASEYHETPAKRQCSSIKTRTTKAVPAKGRDSGKAYGGNNTSSPLSTVMASTSTMISNDLAPSIRHSGSQDLGMFGDMDDNAASVSEPLVPNITASTFPLSLDAYLNMAGRNGHMSVGIDPVQLFYKSTICELLAVDSHVGDLYTLHQLRRYARAYNNEFSALMWYPASNFSALGFALFKDGTFYRHHFAQEITIYREFAIARGDLTRDGSFVPDSPGIAGFPMQTDLEIREALGLIDNKYGLHHDEYNDVLDKLLDD